MTATIAINYSREVGWAGALIAELCATDPSTAIATFNYDGRPEIGVYRATLPAPSFQQALDVLRRSGYDQLPSPATVTPEAKFLTLGERHEGETVPALKPFDLRSVPPALDVVRQELEKIIALVRQHPMRVLKATASWGKPAFRADEPLVVQVALQNASALPITIGNPLAPEAPWNGLRLVVWQPDGEESTADLHASHLRAPPDAPQDGEATLGPGETLAFEIKKKVYLPPGAYEGRLAYQNVIERDSDVQFVRGELWLDLGALAVERPARRR
jgi:hypothetical protein